MTDSIRKRPYVSLDSDYKDINNQKINMLKSIVGNDVSLVILQHLLSKHKGDLDRAIDDFFSNPQKYEESNWIKSNDIKSQPTVHRYYIGDTVVTGWSTFSGVTHFREEEELIINRNSAAKLSESIKRSRNTSFKRNTIVRFSTRDGREIGRLPGDVAKFVSKLMDLEMCEFTATLVFCDNVLKTGDEILIHMKCYLLKNVFNMNNNNKNYHSYAGLHRKSYMDEETLNERNLALLSLFRTLALKPTRSALRNKKKGSDGNDEESDSSNIIFDRIAQSISTINSEASKDDNNIDENDNNADENKEVTDGQLDTIYDNAQFFDAQITPVKEPDTMALQLKPYQQRALAWMISKEKIDSDVEEATDKLPMHPLWEEYCFPTDPSDNIHLTDKKKYFYYNPYNGQLDLVFPEINTQEKGGILADEMGLGKTIEMLSLIHANRFNTEKMTPPTNNSYKSPTTLIICPTSLLAQWRDEIIRGSVPGSLTAEVYYGNRTSDLKDHLCVWDGTAPDVLISTYGTILAEASKPDSLLHEIEFWRIILDEAHHIKNRSSKSSKACYALKSTRRWAVTGTPIQNKLEDLFSLVHFLKHEPWGNYTFWKTFVSIPFENRDPQALTTVKSVLEPLVLRRTKNMRDKNGDPIVPLPSKQINIEYLALSEPEKDIYESLYKDSKTKFSHFCSAGTALRNYMSILQLLTRLRQTTCHPYLVLKKSTNNNSSTDYITDENGRITIESLIEKYNNSSLDDSSSNSAKNDDVSNTNVGIKSVNESKHYSSTVLKNILSQQNAYSKNDEKDDDYKNDEDDNENEDNPLPEECPVCFESIESVIMLPCMHMTCRPCIMEYLQKKVDQGVEGDCPICRQGPIQEANLLEITKQHNTGLSKPILDVRQAVGGFRSSTKINALLRHLKNNIMNEQKTVVFSQFTGFLDLIGVDLKMNNISYLRFDGTLTQSQREETLAKFKRDTNDGDDKIMVMLISLRAGGVGLNLTCANQVIMMDPWWNFAVESQAIDRVHRLGQLNEVVVTRFIIKDSVEEQILAIQNRKHAIMNELYMSKDEQKAKHLQELQTLFNR